MKHMYAKNKYIMLLIISAALIAPACSKTDKTSLMAATAAGAITSCVGGMVHFFGTKLGIKGKHSVPSEGAEARSNSRTALNNIKK